MKAFSYALYQIRVHLHRTETVIIHIKDYDAPHYVSLK